MSRKFLFAVIALLCSFTTAALAQTSFGRISGTITDPGGAAVANVPVEVRNLDTQAVRTINANASGFFLATDLPIGNYSVRISAPGFQSQERTGFQITADARLTADFQLQIGSLSQSVEVTAVNGETLNTTSGELARTIDTKQVQNLALNGRNYVQLMTLVPGAVVTNPDQFSVTTSLAASNQNINGNRVRHQ